MSTIPGESSWADAGLLPPRDDAVPTIAPAEAAEVEVVPSAPRPDLRDEAAEADVVDQALEAATDDEDHPEG